MNRVRSSVIALSLVVIVFLSTAMNVFAIEWGSYQKDESRNGFTLESIIPPLRLTNEIKIDESLSGGILINGNDFFFTTKEGTVGSGNSFSGSLNWRRKLNGSIQDCAVLSSEDIIVSTKNGNLYCLSQKTGAILWSTSLNAVISSPLMQVYYAIYLTTEDGNILCINRKDGSMLWSTNLKEEITTGMCYKNYNLYTITNKGQLVCINGQSGQVIWNKYINASTHFPPIASTESIYVGDDNGTLFCFDHYSDKLYWEKELSSGLNAAMAFAYYDRRFLIVSLKDRYIGLTTGNGNEAWSYLSDDTSVPAISAGRQVFLQGSDQKLVVLDSFDGKEIFSFPLKTKITTSLSIGNGKLFLGTQSGKIFIFSSDASDFQIELPAPIQTISPGEKTQFEISITTTEFFNQSITFSVSGFPCSCKGVNRYFDKQAVSNAQKINLIIEASTDASEGRYKFTVSGRSETGLARIAYGILEITSKKQNTTLQLIPKKTSLLPNDDFVVEVTLSNAKNVHSASFMLNYPPELLKAEAVKMGSFFAVAESDQLFDHQIEPTIGQLIIGSTRKNGSETGSGVVASITFKALKSGQPKIYFSKISSRDTFQEELLVIPSDLVLTVNPVQQKKIVMVILQKTILIDGVAYPLESPPVIESNRTLTPLRVIAENLETAVTWDGKEQKITLIHFDKVIELWINQDTCLVNGIKKAMPSNVPPRILYNRTYVPLRFIADELNATVLWEAKTQTITILYPK